MRPERTVGGVCARVMKITPLVTTSVRYELVTGRRWTWAGINDLGDGMTGCKVPTGGYESGALAPALWAIRTAEGEPCGKEKKSKVRKVEGATGADRWQLMGEVGEASLFCKWKRVKKVVFRLCQPSAGRYDMKKGEKICNTWPTDPPGRVKKSRFNKKKLRRQPTRRYQTFFFHPRRAQWPCVGRDWRKTMTKILERAAEKKKKLFPGRSGGLVNLSVSTPAKREGN